METELYNFVECNADGVINSTFYGTRVEADERFDEIALSGPLFVAYYCASVGGLVNAWSVPS